MIRIALIVAGGSILALGGLWFLQGTGVAHLKPVACVARCEELKGPSLVWAAAGAGLMLAGAGAIAAGAMRRR